MEYGPELETIVVTEYSEVDCDWINKDWIMRNNRRRREGEDLRKIWEQQEENLWLFILVSELFDFFVCWNAETPQKNLMRHTTTATDESQDLSAELSKANEGSVVTTGQPTGQPTRQSDPDTARDGNSAGSSGVSPQEWEWHRIHCHDEFLDYSLS
jgi:hypothetical protein